MTCMWHLSDNRWGIQTDDPEVSRRLQRKVNFKRCIWGMNVYLAGFSFKANKASNAIRTFTRVTGQKPKMNRQTAVYS